MEQRSDRQAATLADACEWLNAQDRPAQPQSHHPDAVNVLTYHGAKGLEWPVVLLAELDAKAKGSPFGIIAEDESPADWHAPLANRVLRYWPWPYGAQSTNLGLDVAASGSAEGIASMQEERRERTRLLYVGMTRARDHLGLALNGPSEWLDELRDDGDVPMIVCGEGEVRVGGETFATRPAPNSYPDRIASVAVEYARPASERAIHVPLRLRPSAAVIGDGVDIVETVVLGPRIALVGDPDMQAVGDLHRPEARIGLQGSRPAPAFIGRSRNETVHVVFFETQMLVLETIQGDPEIVRPGGLLDTEVENAFAGTACDQARGFAVPPRPCGIDLPNGCAPKERVVVVNTQTFEQLSLERERQDLRVQQARIAMRDQIAETKPDTATRRLPAGSKSTMASTIMPPHQRPKPVTSQLINRDPSPTRSGFQET